jgi:hypothetical protein
MNLIGYQSGATRFSLLDPPAMTVIVYGGLLVIYLAGEVNSPMGRLLAIPAILGVLIVPIFTFRALGHAVMSTLGGGRLMRLTSGVLLIERVGDRFRFGLNNRWGRYAGSAITAPAPTADLRRWVRWREWGSFLGLLAYVAVVLLISAWLQRIPAIADDVDRSRLVTTITFGISVLLITLGVWQLINRHVPRIWRMWRGGERADREAAIIAMTSLLLVGQRPREWPEQWPELAAQDSDESVEGLYGCRFAYLHALDSGDLERADHYFRHLEEHADRLPNRMRTELVDLERPFVEAWIRGNADRARELLNSFENAVVQRYRLRRIQAAVLFTEGEWQSARECATEGLNSVSGNADDGEVRAELAIMEEILDRTGEELAAATAGEA